MRVYISGKITGTTDYMERFARAEKLLIKDGYSVVNPAKVNSGMPEDTTWDEYMKMSICMLELCTAIYMLPDWWESVGATMEHNFAKENGYKIIYGKKWGYERDF